MAIEHLWSESLRPTESGVVWNSTKTNTGLRSLHQIWPQLVALALAPARNNREPGAPRGHGSDRHPPLGIVAKRATGGEEQRP